MRRREFFQYLRAERIDDDRNRQVRRCRGNFFEQHQHGAPVDAHAAIGFADRASHQAELRQLTHDLRHLLARHGFDQVAGISPAISLSPKPASRKISTPCSPRTGTAPNVGEGVPEKEAVRRANLYAGLSTTGVGTQKSFYDRARFDAEWKARA